MSEKPIPFSAPMVRAILEGRKTQTRRLLKAHMPLADFFEAEGEDRGKLWWAAKQVPLANPGDLYQFRCRYGVAGDTLWVREAWRVAGRYNDVAPRDLPPKSMTVLYGAGGSMSNAEAGVWAYYPDWPRNGTLPEWAGRPRPSIHMPRWASRLTLKVTSVKVERLQDISYEDACAEGLEVNPIGPETCAHGETWEQTARRLRWPQRSFEKLWDSLNAERAPWASNPYVWVIGFQREGM